MTQWLVRRLVSDQFQLTGPFTLNEVRGMIEKGQLTAEDEVCPENGYWFALREGEEVRKHLGEGVMLAGNGSEDGEVTEPDVTARHRQLASAEHSIHDTESTGVFRVSRATQPSQAEPIQAEAGSRKARQDAVQPAPSPSSSPPAISKHEKQVFLFFLVFLGVLLAAGAVIWLLRALKA